jgi:hypothetical protein
MADPGVGIWEGRTEVYVCARLGLGCPGTEPDPAGGGGDGGEGDGRVAEDGISFHDLLPDFDPAGQRETGTARPSDPTMGSGPKTVLKRR